MNKNIEFQTLFPMIIFKVPNISMDNVLRKVLLEYLSKWYGKCCKDINGITGPSQPFHQAQVKFPSLTYESSVTEFDHCVPRANIEVQY